MESKRLTIVFFERSCVMVALRWEARGIPACQGLCLSGEPPKRSFRMRVLDGTGREGRGGMVTRGSMWLPSTCAGRLLVAAD